MGYDFDIVTICDNRIVARHGSGYLTSNFSNQSEKVGWYIRDDLHGLPGREVAKRARDTISRMLNQGFAIGVPDVTNSGRGWGNDMEEKETIGVFLYHLNRFAEMGERNPDCFFIADNGCPFAFRDKNGEWQKILPNEKDEYDVCETAFRHSIKGTIKIATFDDAMEVFQVFCAQGNKDHAQQWKKLAFSLPGAPNTPPLDLNAEFLEIC